MGNEKSKILFKVASKGRPSDLFETLDSIYETVSDKENMYVLLTLGEDDLSVNNKEVIDRFNSYKNLYYIFGENTGKVQATNKDMDLVDMPWSDWDILINSADDQRFIYYGFDELVRQTMEANFPDNDGFIHLWEPDAGAALPVLYCAGRKHFEIFGFIAHPQYKSLWWDNFYFSCAKLMAKYVYVDIHVFNHLCPAYLHHGKPKDSMFLRDQGLWGYDENVYRKHEKRNFDLTIEDGKWKFNLIMDKTEGNDD